MEIKVTQRDLQTTLPLSVSVCLSLSLSVSLSVCLSLSLSLPIPVAVGPLLLPYLVIKPYNSRENRQFPGIYPQPSLFAYDWQ